VPHGREAPGRRSSKRDRSRGPIRMRIRAWGSHTSSPTTAPVPNVEASSSSPTRQRSASRRRIHPPAKGSTETGTRIGPTGAAPAPGRSGWGEPGVRCTMPAPAPRARGRPREVRVPSPQGPGGAGSSRPPRPAPPPTPGPPSATPYRRARAGGGGRGPERHERPGPGPAPGPGSGWSTGGEGRPPNR